jgi:hypothetical protein
MELAELYRQLEEDDKAMQLEKRAKEIRQR